MFLSCSDKIIDIGPNSDVPEAVKSLPNGAYMFTGNWDAKGHRHYCLLEMRDGKLYDHEGLPTDIAYDLRPTGGKLQQVERVEES